MIKIAQKYEQKVKIKLNFNLLTVIIDFIN